MEEKGARKEMIGRMKGKLIEEQSEREREREDENNVKHSESVCAHLMDPKPSMTYAMKSVHSLESKRIIYEFIYIPCPIVLLPVSLQKTRTAWTLEYPSQP